jgi:hypothetical protein
MSTEPSAFLRIAWVDLLLNRPPRRPCAWKYLMSAPTMRIPESIRFTINPYLAFRAVLLAISEFQPRERFLKDRFLCLFRRIFENPHMPRAEIPRKAKWMSERLFSRSLDSAPIN